MTHHPARIRRTRKGAGLQSVGITLSSSLDLDLETSSLTSGVGPFVGESVFTATPTVVVPLRTVFRSVEPESLASAVSEMEEVFDAEEKPCFPRSADQVALDKVAVTLEKVAGHDVAPLGYGIVLKSEFPTVCTAGIFETAARASSEKISEVHRCQVLFESCPVSASSRKLKIRYLTKPCCSTHWSVTVCFSWHFKRILRSCSDISESSQTPESRTRQC